MAELDVLGQLLCEDLFDDTKPESGGWSADLREPDHQAKLKTVCIRGLPEGTVVLKLHCKCWKSLLRPECSHLSLCDYLLLSRMGSRKVALFVELKSKRPGRDKPIHQFKGAECLVDYCDAALERFHDHKDLLQSYAKHFVVFYITRANKTPTRPQRPPSNSTPESFLKCANPEPSGVWLNNLLIC